LIAWAEAQAYLRSNGKNKGNSSGTFPRWYYLD
jgi:hypothetical protein